MRVGAALKRGGATRACLKMAGHAAAIDVAEKSCEVCGVSYPNVGGILRHLRTIHCSDSHFSANCRLGGCGYTARSFTALYSHVYRNHPGIIQRRGDCDIELERSLMSSLVTASDSSDQDNELTAIGNV